MDKKLIIKKATCMDQWHKPWFPSKWCIHLYPCDVLLMSMLVAHTTCVSYLCLTYSEIKVSTDYCITWQCYICDLIMWVSPQRCGCLVTWFCYQLIAKSGNTRATPLWPDPYVFEQKSYGCLEVSVILYLMQILWHEMNCSKKIVADFTWCMAFINYLTTR